MWLAVSKEGIELAFNERPVRNFEKWTPKYPYISDCVTLPNGTIEKLTGKTLKWEDDSIELCRL